MRARRCRRGDLPRIAAEAWVDPSRRIHLCGETAYVPVREGCAWDTELPERMPYRGRGFQRLGDVIVLHGRPPDAGELAAIVAWERPRGILHLRSLEGATRTPETVLLYGTCGEVCQRENGCRYWLDPERVMFAQGNREERARMGAVVRESRRCERIADLCAGIGYFTVPMARSGGDVHAIELNPVAFRYLERNVAENGVQDRVQCSCGDCRDLLEGWSWHCSCQNDAYAISPLASALFDAAPVEAVTIWSGMAEARLSEIPEDWETAARQLGNAIRKHVASGLPAVLPEVFEGLPSESELARLARQAVEREINPVVRAHGGAIQVESVRGNTLFLRMEGGCQGCSASSVTLRMGVERSLREAVPGLGAVVDLTDHAGGANPYL